MRTSATAGLVRKEYMARSNEFKRAIMEYLDMHGSATNAELAAHTGMATDQIRGKMGALMASGLAHSELIPTAGQGKFIALYRLGMGEDKGDRIKQRMVSKWKPHAKPDPYALPVAFFRGQA